MCKSKCVALPFVLCNFVCSLVGATGHVLSFHFSCLRQANLAFREFARGAAKQCWTMQPNVYLDTQRKVCAELYILSKALSKACSFFLFFFCFLQRFFSYPFWCGFLNSFCLTNSPVSLLFYYGGASQNNCLVGLDMYCCSLKSALTCVCVCFFFFMSVVKAPNSSLCVRSWFLIFSKHFKTLWRSGTFCCKQAGQTNFLYLMLCAPAKCWRPWWTGQQCCETERNEAKQSRTSVSYALRTIEI